MPVSETTYQLIALEDPEGQWELHRGRLREKPAMSIAHNRLTMRLARQLDRQLDLDVFDLRVNLGRVRRADETYYVPDIYVLRGGDTGLLPSRPDVLEVTDDPLPLVIEVWSPSTGGYDVDAKLPEYQRRGDLEIWRLHPYDRTLTAWRRQSDGSYVESVHRSGTLEPIALPGVVIDLDALFR